MQIITDLVPPPWPGERTVVTIGAYDGVHIGHQAVIDEVRAIAAAAGAKAVVLTFDRHPATVVRPESAPPLLTSLEQRLELLAATGLDGTVVLRFDDVQAKESPESFIERVLIEGLAVKVVVVGEDFHFGSHRDGNVRLLEAYGVEHDFVVEPVDLVARDDGIEEPVSSTAIRRALAGGEVELAAHLLGRPHEVRGKVVMGDQRGRLLGFPTANVEVPNAMCLPADGVYAGWYVRPGGREYQLRDQHRPAPDVLRARRPLAARGPPARLRRRPLRRAGARPLRPLPAQRAQVRRHRRAQGAARPRRRAQPPAAHVRVMLAAKLLAVTSPIRPSALVS